MNDLLSAISTNAALELKELVRGGQMTVETYTELVTLAVSHSRLSARTTSASTSLDGSGNSKRRLVTQREFLGYSYTSAGEHRIPQSSTPHSHSGCWCNYSKKPVTSE